MAPAEENPQRRIYMQILMLLGIYYGKETLDLSWTICNLLKKPILELAMESAPRTSSSTDKA